MTQTAFLRAHLPGRGETTILVDEGIVTSISDGDSEGGRSIQTIDLEGSLVLPPLVEPHAHLDKAFLADRIPNPSGDLRGAIEAMVRSRETITESDVADRAERAARAMAAHGVSRIRTHVDTTLETGLVNVLGVLEAKNRCGSLVDIEVVVLLDWPITGVAAQSRLSLAKEAIAAGADVVGGCPHLDDDPVGAVHTLVDLALEHGVPLDLHADENLNPESDDLGTLARRIIADNLQLEANASHCVSLSVKAPAEQSQIALDVARAGVTVTVLPQTNLYLQSRETTSGQVRAIAPVDVLRTAGVRVAAGADNMQDPFNPIGSGDPLETAALVMWASHQSAENALDMVSGAASLACSVPPTLLQTGMSADFMALKALNVRDAIARRPVERIVVRRGRVV
ncbi:MAG: amidohydrolase family protein [Ilumatobacteraceae bacterium]